MPLRKGTLERLSGGALALTLSFGMVFAMPGLVLAATTLDDPGSEVLGEDIVNEKETGTYGKNNNDLTDGEEPLSVQEYLEGLGGTADTTVNVTNNAYYVVSIPKTINIADTNGISGGAKLNTGDGNPPMVKLTKANMPKGVNLNISVADITLTSKYNIANAKTLKPSFKTISSLPTSSTVVAEGINNNSWDMLNGTAESYYADGNNIEAELILFNASNQTLNAGQWTGTLAFTITASNANATAP